MFTSAALRGVRLLLAAALLAMSSIVAVPAAQACACGAMVAEELDVGGEVSLITWDGRHEQIDMVFQVDGHATEAAWIMPAPPETELSLGDREIFSHLQWLSRPRPEYRDVWWPRIVGIDEGDGGAPDGAPPQVTTTEVGPFEVSTLSGGDAASVSAWLTAHGFPAREELQPSFQSYIDHGWNIMATRLTAEGTQAFTGDLAPLRLSFPTEEPVYPILLSRHAQQDQDLILYVAAPRNVEISQQASSTPLELTFGGDIEYARLSPGGSGTWRLTKFEGSLHPETITADYRFRESADQSDRYETYEVVRHQTDIPWPIAVAGVAVIAAAVISGIVVFRASKR
ncbi:DUF2330 domain-containing protein [Parenemella sanctibonifatiensis]|uniref:DUF2330 domain-containing protein n=1 Tax=Parenemella sanctibonifatiensis TaxID=2016505 RepID=A0A255E8Z5_9ACTN|nr:DUF2330 domain-containing protein [Parenemella sanctibonifatiensis]OYN88044.1 hypothetical protein CGZ92_05345 [Parenemella sanctibonifatiensis]